MGNGADICKALEDEPNTSFRIRMLSRVLAAQGGGGGLPPGFPGLPGEKKDKGPKKKYEPKPLTRVGKRKRTGGVAVASRLPKVFPTG